MLQTSIQVRPLIWNIENSAIFFGIDEVSGLYWVADWEMKEIISGEFDSLEDAEGTAYEYLFKYAERELLDA